MNVIQESGRWGFIYFCEECGSYMDDSENTNATILKPILTHPTHCGLIFKTPSKCQFAGRVFVKPKMVLAVQKVKL